MPIPPGAQGAYQYLDVATATGHVSIPVDVQAASRVADEKRRRNAGASARFRARRKEKEQANSKEIEDLKDQIRELGEEADFYRRERDYLASALWSSGEPGATAAGGAGAPGVRERHFPRPASPRRRRVPRTQRRVEESPEGGSSAYSSYTEVGEPGGPGRYTRRRLNDEDVRAPGGSSSGGGNGVGPGPSGPPSGGFEPQRAPTLLVQPLAPPAPGVPGPGLYDPRLALGYGDAQNQGLSGPPPSLPPPPPPPPTGLGGEWPHRR